MDTGIKTFFTEEIMGKSCGLRIICRGTTFLFDASRLKQKCGAFHDISSGNFKNVVEGEIELTTDGFGNLVNPHAVEYALLFIYHHCAKIEIPYQYAGPVYRLSHLWGYDELTENVSKAMISNMEGERRFQWEWMLDLWRYDDKRKDEAFDALRKAGHTKTPDVATLTNAEFAKWVIIKLCE
jgi:hypothetical protein